MCVCVWCLTIGHAIWCGALLSAMPVGVVPHYRPCLLVWYLTIGYVGWSIATATDFLPVEGRWKKGCTSLVLLVRWCHYTKHACWFVATLRYACLYRATLSDMYAGFIYSFTRVCKVLLYQAKASGLLQIHQICLQVGCHTHGFVKLVSYFPGRHLGYIEFWIMHE